MCSFGVAFLHQPRELKAREMLEKLLEQAHCLCHRFALLLGIQLPKQLGQKDGQQPPSRSHRLDPGRPRRPPNFQAQANQFQLLTRYKQRINRNLRRNPKQLRAERREQHARALEEA